eukprot:166310_1
MQTPMIQLKQSTHPTHKNQFLLWFLNKMHQDVNLRNTAKKQDFPMAKVLYDKNVADEHWNKAMDREKSFFSDVFCGQWGVSHQCLQCNNINTIYELFFQMDLQISLNARETGTTVENCIKEYIAGEKLTGKNSYKCENCNSNWLIVLNKYYAELLKASTAPTEKK